MPLSELEEMMNDYNSINPPKNAVKTTNFDGSDIELNDMIADYNSISVAPASKNASLIDNITDYGLVEGMRATDQQGLDRVRNQIKSRPNMVNELRKIVTETPTLTIAQELSNPLRLNAKIGGGALTTIGTAAQIEENAVASSLDALIDFAAGDPNALSRVPQEVKDGFSGKSRKEVGDLFRRAGYPEWAAQTLGAGIMMFADPVARTLRIANVTGLGMRSGFRAAKESVQNLGREMALAGVENTKRATQNFLLKKPADLIEYTLNPTNTKNITRAMLRNPGAEATKFINELYDDFAPFKKAVATQWDAVNKSVTKIPIPRETVKAIYYDAMDKISEEGIKTSVVHDINNVFKRNKIFKQVINDDGTIQTVFKDNATIGDFLKVKDELAPFADQKLPLHTRTIDAINDSIANISDDFRMALEDRRLQAVAEEQMKNIMGPARTRARVLKEAPRKNVSSTLNSNKVLDYWKNPEGSLVRQESDALAESMRKITGGAKGGPNQVARQKALAAAQEYSSGKPSTSGLYIGGTSVIAGALGVPAPVLGAATGLALAEASPRLNLATTKFLTNALSEEGLKYSPKVKALLRITGATLDEGMMRAVIGRERSIGQAVNTGMSGVFDPYQNNKQ